MFIIIIIIIIDCGERRKEGRIIIIIIYRDLRTGLLRFVLISHSCQTVKRSLIGMSFQPVRMVVVVFTKSRRMFLSLIIFIHSVLEQQPAELHWNL